MDINPIIKLDYPDPDVIRVGDTYYMVSTTMHFMPGCVILRSYDLVNWEHAAYVYDTLDSTSRQRLTDEENIYGKGMWAATIRFHKGKFYICFVANDTGKTYLFTAEDIEGPWIKNYIDGFYHDCSLLFDDDNRVYIVYGNKHIWLTELKADLSGPKVGGLNRMIVSDEGHPGLGYEGAHMYKINGRYYVFFIHSRRDRWMRVEACFAADTLDGEFNGKDVLEDDRSYYGMGVAQGGIVDTPDGKWYAILFQDSGAAGRIPVLVPVKWLDGYPIFGEEGKIPEDFPVSSTRPDYEYTPLIGSDDFKYLPNEYGRIRLDAKWQFNHEPDNRFYSINGEEGYYQITSSKVCNNLTQAVNTLTQRMLFPSCSAEVTINAHDINEGDYAGICALQGCYGMVAVTRRDGKLYIVMKSKESEKNSNNLNKPDIFIEDEWQSIPIDESTVRFKVIVNFMNMKDESYFYYHNGKDFVQIGKTHKLYFKLDHFTGCRFGLFMYSTKHAGGKAYFSRFVYNY